MTQQQSSLTGQLMESKDFTLVNAISQKEVIRPAKHLCSTNASVFSWLTGASGLSLTCSLMRSIRTIPVFLLLWLLSTNLVGQGEANHWYFGNYAGVDFNSGSPVALTNSAMVAWEGCASISDANGNLLFYTNGVTIWNANHQIMSNGNGLIGNISATQSAIIVPRPNHPGIYYVFSLHSGNSTWALGLRYSEVDMSLQGGLGAVTTNKNVLVVSGGVSGATEKLTAVANASGTGYWVLNPPQAAIMRAFEVTAAGVNITPVVSTLTGVPSLVCQMKASPDGRWLALGGYNWGGNTQTSRLAKFDNATGMVTSDTVLSSTSYNYGVEFSAGSQYLYINSGFSGQGFTQGLYQFDLSSNSFSSILNSVVLISGSNAFRAMQLGPDKKIYLIQPSGSFLDVINSPDSAGVACGFQAGALSLPFGNNAMLGLPGFIQSGFASTQFVWEDTCHQDTTLLAALNQFSDSINWNFGDTASGSANFAQGDSVSHVFSSYGTFSVIATTHFLNTTGFVSYQDSLIDTMLVTIHPYPQIDLGSDTILCEGDSIEIANSNTSLVMNYLWLDSSTAINLPIFQADTYYVEVSTVCGVAYDTIVIDSVIPALVDLGPDSTFCDGDTVTLALNLPLAQYVWHDNDTGATYDATTTGWYSVTASGVCNTDHDSVYFSFVAPPTTNMPEDTVFCAGSFASLEVTADSVSYLWQDSSSLDFFQATQPDTYSVIVTGPCGVFYDSTIVLIDDSLTVNLGNDTVLCQGFTHWHPANVPERVSLFWSDSTTADSFFIDAPLTLWLGGYNTCNADTDTLIVYYEVPPEIDLPEEVLFCTGEAYDADVTFSRSQYQWSHGNTSGQVSLGLEGTYTVTVTNLCGQDVSSMELLVDYPLTPDLGGPYDICEGDTVRIDVTVPNRPVYAWNNGASSPNIVTTKAGFYKVTITNSCGSYTNETAVYLRDKPQSFLPFDTVICASEPWNIRLLQNYTSLQWQDGMNTSDYSIDTSGTYWLSMQNACGWSTDTLHVRYSDLPDVNLGADTFVCPSISTLMLDANGQEGVVYMWQDGTRASSFEVTEAGLYTVDATNADGCALREQIFVNQCPVRIWIPTAFSPNADQVNDVFLPQLSFVTDYHLTIFDRWGHPVFSTKSLDEGWDGTAGADLLPGGLYTYSLDFKSDELGPQQLRGSLTLLR